MMTTRLLLGAGLCSLTLTLFACAGDPNKQANDARDAELKAERKQVQTTADDRSEARVEAAGAQRDTTEANATGGSAKKDRVGADAKMTEARAIYRAKSTERLEKADARTAELKALVEKAGGKATTASRDALKTVETQRSLVTRELDNLPKMADDDFKKVQTSLDTQLDNLEGLVKKAANEVDKFKR
jgi:hypothetical protein